MFHMILVAADGYEGRSDALALARTLVDDHGDVVIVDDSPSDVLHRRAVSEHADLIVVSAEAHHHGPLLAQRDCPVAVAPCGYRHAATALCTLGVAFNGSADAHAAAVLAARLARALGARLRLRTAVEPAGRIDYEEAVRRANGDLARVIAALDLRAAGDVVQAAPEVALQTFSQDVDLLLTGTPGEPRGWRRLAGSPTEWLALHAGCPMIVVPAATVAAPASAVGA
jgi:nucleotide-binding universal stress UspA family protein